MKKILITGSNGLLGQKLVTLLLNQEDVALVATARGDNRLPNDISGFEFISLDISDREQVMKAIEAVRPAAIINTAAMTNVDQCETDQDECLKLNVDAVSYLVEAAEKFDFFLLHLSTDFIFDGKAGPYDEEALPAPLSFYGHSKLKAEKIIKNSKARWAIARTVLVFGIANDMSRSNIVLWVKKNLEEGKTIQVVNDQFRTPTLAEDLAMGCWLIVKQEATGIYNISGKDFLTPYDMAIKTARFYKLDESLIIESDSTKFTQPAKRPLRTGFIIDKAIKNLNYSPLSFEEGLVMMNSQMS